MSTKQPRDLLAFTEDTIIIKEADKVRRKRCEASEDDLEMLGYCWIRHEPDRNMLYVKAKYLRNLIKELPEWAPLLTSGQYVGSMIFSFYGYTPYHASNMEVIAFDLSRPETTAVRIPDNLRKAKYKAYEKKYGIGSREIIKAMAKWERVYTEKLQRGNSLSIAKRTDTDLAVLKLQEQIRALRAQVNRRPLKRKAKPSQHLPELDDYIKSYEKHIRRLLVRRVVDNGVPRLEERTYDPAKHGLQTVGYWSDVTDITGKRESVLAIQIASLKQDVPNFKEDIRKRTSKSVRIHSNTAQGSIYCAMFDMLQKPKG